jgi:glycine C-acetyltransferase
LIAAACSSLEQRGFGLASVRFICGTQDQHKVLEKKISEFFGTEDTILYSSGFDANTGLFETLLTAEDAVLSDEFNHASIIDGIRLCKAVRFRYAHSDLRDLENQLREAAPQRFRLVATDGVFSMDGDIADLKTICDLAEKHNALVMIDDAHAAGFLGRTGRGTPEHCGVEGRIDVITGTLGKAFGGASGGYTTGRKEIIELLRQRSRPYLFSNTLGARDRRRGNQSARASQRFHCPARSVDGKHALLPGATCEDRTRCASRRSSHHSRLCSEKRLSRKRWLR